MTDTTPSVLDMENSAETASYRKSRRMLLEQIAAAYSDYHVTGLNPAGNASLTDLAFVAGRFRITQSRRPAAAAS